MNLPLSQKLEDKITRICENFEHPDKDFVLYEIFKAAASYWTGLDEDDFCLQSCSGSSMVFGGTNRLIWTPWFGFKADRSYCSMKFLARYDTLGPLPGAR